MNCLHAEEHVRALYIQYIKFDHFLLPKRASIA